MNNEQFMATYGEQNNARDNMNLHRDGDGNIYSYGRHYPLLFHIDEIKTDGVPLWIVNTSGYSNTTSKHIALARPYADMAVDWNGGLEFTREKLIDNLKRNLESINRAIAQTRPRTKKLTALVERMATVTANLDRITLDNEKPY